MGRCVVRNTSLSWRLEPLEGTAPAARLRSFLKRLSDEQRPDAGDGIRHGRGAVRGRLSKFEPCVPPRLLDAWIAERTIDLESARRCLDEL